MFGSAILEVLIGLVTVFLLLSLAATALREIVEAGFKSRAVLLERGIRELLGDPEGKGLVRSFYEHPLIYALYRGEYQPADRRRLGRKLPTYIPAASFSGALLDIAIRGQHAGPYAAEQTEPSLTTDELRHAARRLPNAHVRRAVIAAIDDARGDLSRVRTNLERWFDASMDRVSGWYKRKTQVYLFIIGVLLAGSLNVNALTIADHLWKNPAIRQSVVERVTQLQADSALRQAVGDSTPAQRQAQAASDILASLDLPIGWNHLGQRPVQMGRFNYAFQIVVGILITAFAVTLGAPFWFDTLNKVMVIRSTVKPHEKSPEEASEDRQAKKPAQVVTGTQGAAAATQSPPAAAPPPPGPAPATAAAAPVAPDFTPQTWAVGDPEEGVL